MTRLNHSFGSIVRASSGNLRKPAILIVAAACLAVAPLAHAGDHDHDGGHDRDRDGAGRYFDSRVSVIQGRAPSPRIDIDVHIGPRDPSDRFPAPEHREPVYEQRTERVWVDPVYRTVCERVWVPAEYRTVTDRVWREPVVEDRCERVWVAPEYATLRETQRDRWGRAVVVERRVKVRDGYWKDEKHQLVVRDGCWEDVTRQELVHDGCWKDVTRQELVSAGHWEDRTTRVPVATHWDGWDHGDRRG